METLGDQKNRYDKRCLFRGFEDKLELAKGREDPKRTEASKVVRSKMPVGDVSSFRKEKNSGEKRDVRGESEKWLFPCWRRCRREENRGKGSKSIEEKGRVRDSANDKEKRPYLIASDFETIKKGTH